MLTDLFQIPIPLAEKIVRSLLVYFALVILLRVFGKRELAQLSPFDLIVLLTLSNTVQNAIIGNDNSLTGGILGALTLLAANFVTVRLMFRHPKLDRLFGGKSTPLIEHGKLKAQALQDELLSTRELRVAANRQGIEDLHHIEHATLEPNGTFTFERKHTLPAEEMQAQLLARLDAIEKRLAEAKP
ncbi:MAG: hypothetical protein RL328_286 [Acidobacteriota bacterium]